MLYKDKTKNSEKLYKTATELLPGGVSHCIRYFPPYPFYVERADGCYIWDVDGNRYVDFWMGHYAHILGHRAEVVVEAVTDFIRKNGYHFGLPNPWEVELAELVRETIPCAEAVRFCSSGTEATMYAVRLARACTGKNVVVKVKGGWHGASTDLTKGVNPPFEEKESLGIPETISESVKLIPFNDWENTEKVLNDVEDDLACVIIEPVLGVGGFIPAEKDYLVKLKEKVEKAGAILIFDEVISGFRVGLSGYQGMVGITPHLTTLGKVLGGGFPIGAICGRKDILELASCCKKKPERVLIGGGTFSCNPVSMIAGIAVIRYLLEHEKEVYNRLRELTCKLKGLIKEIANNEGVTVKTTGIESLFMIHIMKEDSEIKGADDIIDNTYWEIRDSIFRTFMATEGVCIIHAAGAISTAHTEREIEFFAEKFAKFLRENKCAFS